MDRRRRTQIVGAVLLILLGAWIILIQIFPDLRIFDTITFSWPMIIIGVGVLMFIFGLIGGEPDMAVPAAVVSGIGCILYWQNETGNWETWSYVWALIPGFAGVGSIISGLLGKNTGKSIRDGITMIIISAIMFAIFGSWLGELDILGDYWPLLLILLGVWILISYFLGSRKSRKKSQDISPDSE